MDIAPADQQPATRSANKYVSKPARKFCVARELRAHTKQPLANSAAQLLREAGRNKL